MNKIVSLLIGIVISLTLQISVLFPSLESDLPLLAEEHKPETGFALVLEQIRCSIYSGYGICCGVTALMIAWLVYRNRERLADIRYRHKILLYFVFCKPLLNKNAK